MDLLQKVVWSEGMYLGPHHFQAQNRYFEDLIQFTTGSLWYAPFGFAGLAARDLLINLLFLNDFLTDFGVLPVFFFWLIACGVPGWWLRVSER